MSSTFLLGVSSEALYLALPTLPCLLMRIHDPAGYRLNGFACCACCAYKRAGTTIAEAESKVCLTQETMSSIVCMLGLWSQRIAQMLQSVCTLRTPLIVYAVHTSGPELQLHKKSPDLARHRRQCQAFCACLGCGHSTLHKCCSLYAHQQLLQHFMLCTQARRNYDCRRRAPFSRTVCIAKATLTVYAVHTRELGIYIMAKEERYFHQQFA